MPTGYTAAIEDGNLSAKEFATRCAHAFGAFAHQRDSRVDSPLTPAKVVEDSYYVKALAKAKERFAKIKSMTSEEIEAGWQEHTNMIIASNRESVERYERDVAKYQTVKDGIDAWVPNEEAKSLKEYCLDQLKISWPYEPYPSTPYVTPTAWYEAQVVSAARDINYYETQAEEERTRLEERRDYGMKMLQSIEDIEESI